MSASRSLFVAGPAGRLEASFREARDPRAAVVLAHPHPLYGGTMHNPVIFHADRELHRAGIATLRFNFRGVGASDGHHDDGRGEAADVGAAALWLRAEVPGVPLVLVGYSFGSRASLFHALADPDVEALIAIGFPVRIWRLDEVLTFRRPLAVVQGTLDEFGPPAEVAGLIGRAEPPGKLFPVEGASHLFPGRAPEAAARVVEAVDWALG